MGCKIMIENSTGTFFPGSTVQGRVLCVFRNGKNIRGIRIKLRGREQTTWTRQESYSDGDQMKSRTIQYKGDNKFLQSAINLANKGTYGAGRFYYQFKFNLPINCPSTIKTRHGSIRYYLKANVDIPWAPDYENEVTFTVVSPVDFNTMPNLIMNPVEYFERNEPYCCCTSGPITMKVLLDKEGFLLGETMKIRVHITNMSSDKVIRLTAKLTMIIKEITTSPRKDSRETKEVLSFNSDGGVAARSERDYELPLIIPHDTILPNFNMCTLFTMWCDLKITAYVDGCHSALKITTRVTLGQVPQSSDSATTPPVYIDGTSYPFAPPEPDTPHDFAPGDPGGSNVFRASRTSPLNEWEIPEVHRPRHNILSGGPPGFNSRLCYPSRSSSTSVPAQTPSGVPYDNGEDFEIINEECEPGQSSSRESPPPSYFDVVNSKSIQYPPL